jgi:hypothetical protein
MISQKVIRHGDYVKVYIYYKSQEFCFAIDADDWENLKQYKWFRVTKGYVATMLKKERKIKLLHHFLLPKKEGYLIDHINRNSLDNRRINLRYISPSENIINQGRFVDKKDCGLSYNKAYKHWEARISYRKERVHLGYFKSKKLALIERKKAEQQYYPHIYQKPPKQVVKLISEQLEV